MRSSSQETHPWQRRSRSRTARAPAFFALMRAWAAGIVVLLLSQYMLWSAVTEPLSTAEHTGAFGWRLLLFHLPTLLCAFLATLAASRIHPEPHRDRPVPHLVAGLTVPLANRAADMALNWRVLSVEGIAAPTAAVLAGCAIAVVLDLAMDGGRQ
ncbi:hypothetical protein NLX86_22135 [Streptomyces sp. A3M-1-3]|uniref:hypothetical protein n=1 Tax=Streptomyces sp. A3M-1-3 TaxID=2962044 RepID=UPI0020B88244|nr:hypothetical protein [Streptomyces sp. A3M-1-3]MCP3820698.1 hypothetical protein [Streptomyces sp. A3M-1-3]